LPSKHALSILFDQGSTFLLMDCFEYIHVNKTATQHALAAQIKMIGEGIWRVSFAEIWFMLICCERKILFFFLKSTNKVVQAYMGIDPPYMRFVLRFFSWSNRRQGVDRTWGELGTGQALLGLLPNGRSRLIGGENEWHGIS
jgi:hypothetical protein